MTKVGRTQGSLSFKSHTILLEHKIFIRVMMKIKSAIYIEFNTLTTFMESRFKSHLFPLKSEVNQLNGQNLYVLGERYAKALFQVINSGVTLLGDVLFAHTTYHLPMSKLNA